MQQFNVQIRTRYSKLFGGTATELNGKPSIYQRRKFIENHFKQTETLLKSVVNNDFKQLSYIKQLPVAEVFKLLNDYLLDKK